MEHNNISLMLNNVDEDEKLTYTIHNSGQNREMWFLNEDGLYEVLMQSRKPIAKQFDQRNFEECDYINVHKSRGYA
ncbi:Bro-N domain-containing protein [Bacillus thuringiensis]|nr:Bro-N domain-containing protein [Bacillus thuringiensis]MEC3570993.1 Bro-N domain-containing protein [Bacillus thuringiensis]MED2018525.1 Bro-N domain-containing protein [Bacillus thuringiensis]MED2143519.1 Bro-N domain-containing protein [Bacillus thuringiensis]MED2517888.1 Bro-N domain-containing protein [Bacillus thuringiensis]